PIRSRAAVADLAADLRNHARIPDFSPNLARRWRMVLQSARVAARFRVRLRVGEGGRRRRLRAAELAGYSHRWLADRDPRPVHYALRLVARPDHGAAAEVVLSPQ